MESYGNTNLLANHNRLLATTQHWIRWTTDYCAVDSRLRGNDVWSSCLCAVQPCHPRENGGPLLPLWIPACAGMTCGRVTSLPCSRVTPAKAGVHCYRRPWVAAPNHSFDRSSTSHGQGLRNASTTVFCAEISAGAEISADPISARNPPSRLTSIKSFADM